MKMLLATIASVLVLALVADLWLVRRIEDRIEDRLGCRLGVEATADVAWWRGLPAVVTRSVGTVRLAVPLDELGAGRGVSVTGEDGRLVVATDRMDASVVLRPALEDGRVAMEVTGVRIGGREVGGLVARALTDRLAAGGLGGLGGGGWGLDGLPDAVRPTGLEVTDDALVVEVDVDPDGLDDQERTGCA